MNFPERATAVKLEVHKPNGEFVERVIYDIARKHHKDLGSWLNTIPAYDADCMMVISYLFN